MPLIPPSPERQAPDVHVARHGAITLTRPIADLFDDKPPIVNACPRAGHWSRVCIVRLAGKHPMRIRLVISATNDPDHLIVRGRIL